MKRKILAILLALILIVPNAAMATQEVREPQPAADLMFFAEILNLIQEDYPFETDESKLVEAGVKGMLRSVDPYSDYYTSDEVEAKFSEITGIFTGIGVYLGQEEGRTYIEDTIKDQPAEAAGIKKGDLIVAIDEKTIEGYSLDDISSLIRGEAGSKVNIKIKRNEELLSFSVERVNITLNPVSYMMIEDDIGYIQLTNFNSKATEETVKALEFFKSKNTNKVILDIRDNPGGLFHEAIETSKLFVAKGDIVHQRMKNQEMISYKSFKDAEDYELVLLVNENSASASEILAGAIKDRGAGTIIGRQTFGKGIIQSLIPITDGSIVKLTTAEYLTPNKTSIHKKGIQPDIVVENNTLDLQLERAIALLKEIK